MHTFMYEKNMGERVIISFANLKYGEDIVKT